jgi:outer membrane lipoprotein SlyB
MYVSLIRRVTALGPVMIALLVMAVAAMGQTARQRPTVQTNDAASYRYAHQHGYRAGYEDGFIKGKSDVNDNQPREFQNSDAYNRADRTYKDSMGTLPEYQEGYRIGFEMGYNDGFYGRPYSISIPTNLGRVVIASVNASNTSGASSPSNSRSRTIGDDRRDDRRDDDRRAEERRADEDRRAAESQEPSRGRTPIGLSRGTVNIADGISMKIRLNDQISTKTNREGDRFTAVVLDPSDYADAVIEGHIAKLTKSGKATGKTEMALAFDTIRLRDGRTGRMAAQVEKVYQSEKVKTVDDEGNVETSSRTKDTATRGVGGAALGAIIGGIAGGGKGAAIGAILGASVGAGSVYVEGGKELVLEPGTEILVRTAAPARTRDQ